MGAATRKGKNQETMSAQVLLAALAGILSIHAAFFYAFVRSSEEFYTFPVPIFRLGIVLAPLFSHFLDF